MLYSLVVDAFFCQTCFLCFKTSLMAKVCISLVAVNTIRRNVHSKISCFVANTAYGKLLGISQKTIYMHAFSLLHKISLSFVYYQSVSLSDKHYLFLFHTNCLYCRHTVCLSFKYSFSSQHNIYHTICLCFLFHSFTHLFQICNLFGSLSFIYSLFHTHTVCISFKHTLSLSHIISLSKQHLFIFIIWLQARW